MFGAHSLSRAGELRMHGCRASTVPVPGCLFTGTGYRPVGTAVHRTIFPEIEMKSIRSPRERVMSETESVPHITERLRYKIIVWRARPWNETSRHVDAFCDSTLLLTHALTVSQGLKKGAAHSPQPHTRDWVTANPIAGVHTLDKNGL